MYSLYILPHFLVFIWIPSILADILICHHSQGPVVNDSFHLTGLNCYKKTDMLCDSEHKHQLFIQWSFFFFLSIKEESWRPKQNLLSLSSSQPLHLVALTIVLPSINNDFLTSIYPSLTSNGVTHDIVQKVTIGGLGIMRLGKLLNSTC